MVRSKISWLKVTWNTLCEETHTTENITFLQLRWRAVIKRALLAKCSVIVKALHGTEKLFGSRVDERRREFQPMGKC